MQYRDYYRILGVPRHASEKEIRRAFRRLARRYHPDRNPGDRAAEERFKEVNEAHEVLADPDKRKHYDWVGAQRHQFQQAGGEPRDGDFDGWVRHSTTGRGLDYGAPHEELSGRGGFSDFFRSLFGESEAQPSMHWRKAQRRPRRGQDIETPVELSLEEAFRGTSRVLEVGGSHLEVKIPPGVKTGSKVRITGKGGPGSRGAPAGDILFSIQVLPHPVFVREGDDLHCEVKVDLYTALLGGEVQVPTMKGAVWLKIPPETQSGRSFRLRGQGMPRMRDPLVQGDLVAKVVPVLPEGLTDQERDAFRELARLRRRSTSGKA
jgi:curved DNA-binding protein